MFRSGIGGPWAHLGAQRPPEASGSSFWTPGRLILEAPGVDFRALRAPIFETLENRSLKFNFTGFYTKALAVSRFHGSLHSMRLASSSLLLAALSVPVLAQVTESAIYRE